MNVAVVRFPGSNCDDDTRYVLQDVLGANVSLVWHQETKLGQPDAVILPGGFSYGDYLRSGAMAAHSPIMQAVIAYANKGGKVIGICNGFQILTEAGLLPGQLARNPVLHFICKNVHMRVENNQTPFTSNYQHQQIINLPIAHNEGSYFADDATIDALEAEGRVVFRYCSATGDTTKTHNPNGSRNNIAGIINKQGNVLGMMPHPERASEDLLGSQDGLPLFTSLKHALDTTLRPA